MTETDGRWRHTSGDDKDGCGAFPEVLWDALEVSPGDCPDGAIVSLGFDGSVSGDCTALVAYEHATGRLVVLGLYLPDVELGRVLHRGRQRAAERRRAVARVLRSRRRRRLLPVCGHHTERAA